MSKDPFSALGIAPTLDLAAAKRAYFARVARGGPHKDPVAFKAIREAYEQLSTTAGRASAMLNAPLDVAALLAPLRTRFDAPLAEAAAASVASRRDAEARHAFISQTSRASWCAAVSVMREETKTTPT